ncbi:hypothetical protein [Pinibacter aurantiacus]|uniref:Tetratricopeptide repeat protein n=1 Tax=Pinibacter aurantiacus TaxID=2851599 RepID=A0A9E2SEF5_9BACT|nr:hypothetical protein [Pinibacter aurantiacus]MBV4359564.1 hypothetical protein [Pinibacter aurantiacus]
MNISSIIQEIFHQRRLEDVSLEQLQTLAADEPYFAPGHFLLLKKLQQTADPGFESQLHKTVLYFGNPLWLQYLLQPTINEPVTEIKREHVHAANVPATQPEAAIAAPVVDYQPQTAIAVQEEEVLQKEAVNDDSEVINAHSNEAIKLEPAVTEEKTASQEDSVIFEPYHTIDYFASLGIKVGKNVPVNDKLGKQLKSFTEWLKTLKRLPDSTIAAQEAEEHQPMPDARVEAMAEVSIKEKETLTESMAEVLLKQGKKETAIEMYNKLSLLNPDKSHYFAAKIEALKQN